MASDNTVQIVIQAKDVASDVIKKAGLAFTDFSKATTDLSQSLVGTGNALQATANYTEVTKNKIASVIPLIAAYSAAVTAAFGSAAVLSQTQFAASVDKTTSVFSQLEQEGTKLSQSLVDVASVFNNLTVLVTANVNANLDLILSSSKVNTALQLTAAYVETVQQKIASTTPVIAAYGDAITVTLGDAIAALPKDQINAVVDSITNVFIQLELESAKLSQYAVEVKSAFNGLTALVAANVNANLDLILSSSEVNAALQLTASYIEAAKEKITSAIPVITAYSNAITAAFGNVIAALPKDQINTVVNKITGAFEKLGQESTKLFQSLIDVDSIFHAITNYGSELVTTFDKVKSSLSQKINTESLAKTDLVVENLNKQTTAFNDNLTISKVKFDLASEQAKEFATEVTETGVASIRSGAEIVAAAGVGVAGLYTLNLLGGQLRETLGTPIAQNIIQLISQQADAATKELVPLSDILTELSTVGSQFGAGFTQGLFSVEDQDPLKQINYELDRSFDRLNKKIRSPINKAFGVNNAPSTLTDEQKLQQRTSKQIGNIGKDKDYTNIAPPSTFEQVDSTVASLFANKKISEQTGIDASNNFVLGFIKNNETARNLLSAPLQELLKGSLLNAILKIPEEQIATNLNKVLKFAFDTVEQTAYLGGSTLAVALFKGIEGISTEEKARLLADQEEIRKLIGGTFDGVGKELIAKLNLSGAPGEFIAKGLGNAIDGAIPKVLTPIITTAARFATKQFKEAGANAVTSLATAIAPDFLKDLVKTTFVTSGLSQTIIEGLTQNIKPSSFTGAFNSIVKLISNPQALSIPNALVSFTVNFTKVIDQLFSKFTNELTSLSNAFNKLRGSPLIDAQIDRLQAGIQKAIAGIGFLQEKNKAISIGIATNGADKIRSLVQDLISLKEKAVGIGVNVVVTGANVIQSVVQSIVFLKEKAKEISIKILVDGANAIESIIQSIISLPQVATAFIESSITNIFSFIDSIIINIEKGVQSLLSFVSNGINFIDSIILNLASSATGLINNIKRPLADLFGDIDYYLEVLRKGLGAAESKTPLKSSLNAGDSVNASKQYIDDAIANIQSKFALLDEISSKSLSSLKDKILNTGNSFGDFAKKSQVAIASISNFASVVSANIQKGTNSLLEFILSAGIFNKVPAVSQTATASVSAPAQAAASQTATAGVSAPAQTATAGVSAPAQAAAASVSAASQTAAAGVSTASQTISQSLLSAFTNPLTQIKAVIGEIVGVVTEGIGRLFKFLFDKGEQENSLIVGFVKNVFGETFIKAFTGIGQTASTSFASGFLGGTFKLVVPAIDLVDKALLNVYNTLSRLPSKIAEPLSKLSLIPAFLGEIDQPLVAFSKLQSVFAGVSNSIFNATQSVFYLSQGFSTLEYAGRAPFDYLIGQTITLREQLLSTQASLVATSKISNNLSGQQIGDPTAAIQALDLPIKTAIAALREGALGLAGVTDSDLVPLFQQIAGQITGIGGSLTNAKDLSLNFAAALGTLRIPLSESRAEIGSILMGTISVDTKLAKILNISNDQVSNWKAQGRLVDELNKRLQPFRAGNALAAESFSGVTSNIKLVVNEIGRIAGERLLDPLLKDINAVYEYLNANKTQFIAYFGAVSDQILRIGLAVAESVKVVFNSVGEFASKIPIYLITTLANVFEDVANAVQFTVTVLSPAIDFLTELSTAVVPLATEFLQVFISMKALSGGVEILGSAFGSVVRLVPGLNSVIYALDLRTNGLVAQFVNLAKVMGTGGGGFLLLGKYLNQIPGATEAAAAALGPLGELLVGFIPAIAQVGIQLSGLILLFPPLGAFLSGLITQAPRLLIIGEIFAKNNIYLAPLAPLLGRAAAAVSVYADATDRVALVNAQFADVIKNVGRAIAGQALAFGLLAGGAYLAFLAFDHFILQNAAFKEVLEAVAHGLSSIARDLGTLFQDPLVLAGTAVAALTVAINVGLLPAVGKLVATTLAGWATGVAAALGGIATTLSALGFTALSSAAAIAGVSIKALGILMTEGALASSEFLTINGVATIELFGFSAAADTAAGSVLVFATAVGTLVAELLILAAPLIILATGIAAIAFIRYTKDLEDSTTATEIFAQETARLSEQALKTANDLKKASDIQAEADKRGVRLADEQYKANQRLIDQGNAEKVALTDRLAELNEQSKQAVGDANQANIKTQIADVQGKIKLLDSLLGNLKIKPIDLVRYGTAYEQIAKQASQAEDALTKSSGDPAIFKQKVEELVSATEKQLKSGEINADEAIRRYKLVATNSSASADIQIKAAEAITASLKEESERRIALIEAEQGRISAQLKLGQVDYETNAQAIADIQNSTLKSRLEAEQNAHETKLKQIQAEFDNQTFVNTSLLKQKEEAARTSAKSTVNYETNFQQSTQQEINRINGALARKEGNQQHEIELEQQKLQLQSQIEASKTRLAQAQDTANKPVEPDVDGRAALAQKLAQIEKDKNLALNSETVRNARIASELNSQITENETAAAKFAADLRVKVKTGAISQELAAERQLTFAKKAELETQLRNANDSFAEQRNLEIANFNSTVTFLEGEKAKKQAEADKLPKNSPELAAANADIADFDAKILKANNSRNSKLALLELSHKTEVLKINADISKNQADSAEKESAIAIKILERNQKKTLDAVQSAQNTRLIQIQQLENKGLLDHVDAEEKKTESTKLNIAAQLNEERLRLKALEALPKPKNQEKGADLDTQIRASQLKVQDLVKQSLDNELTLYHQHIEVVKGGIKEEDNIREAQLERQSRRGLVTQAQVTEELARRKVASLQAEYNLETKDEFKRTEIALSIEKAKTALLDAEIKTRQEKLEVENQKLKNQIDEQNESVKRQGDLYEILTKALEQRNKLLEISKDLAKAGTDYVVGELEVLSSVERSEYRRKQIVEITASIKLESLRKQQEFERQSLLNQIEQNKLTLEQEVIKNRISQGDKIASIAGVQADIAIAQADPRNKSEAGQAKIKALQLKLQAEIDGFTLLKAEGGLIVQQFEGQQTAAKAQLEQLDLKQKLETLKQRAELANALPPGKQQQAQRQIQKEIAESLGQKNVQGLYNAGIAKSRGIAGKEFPISTTPDVLAAINPNLGGILDIVGSRGANAAIADTQQTFNRQYGNTANITGALTTGISKTPLRIPSEVQKSQTLSDEIFKKASQPISLPGGASIKLPQPSERGAFLSLENSGKLFSEGIDKLLAYLKDQSATSKKGSTYNIKLDTPQKGINASGTGGESSLENVLNLAKQMAGAY